MAYKRAFDEMFMEGAVHIVAKNGIENLRTKDVADYAGFSEATLFRAFETKDELLRRAFLEIDKRISDILTQSIYIRNIENTPFELAMYAVWHKIYRYMVENGEETLFLIRYRYSSFYTDEVRKLREVYSGSFDKVYDLLEEKLGGPAKNSRDFLFNFVFEVTLCFAEKVVSGSMEDSEETECFVWNAVSNAAKGQRLAAEA